MGFEPEIMKEGMCIESALAAISKHPQLGKNLSRPRHALRKTSKEPRETLMHISQPYMIEVLSSSSAMLKLN